MRVFRPAQNIVSTKGRFLFASILLTILFLSIMTQLVSAAEYPKLSNRSLFIDDVTPGATTTYTISFAYPAATTIGSIRLLMCDTPVIDDPCVNPGGSFQLATLDSQTGITGFGILSQSDDEIILSRAPAGAGTVQSTYQFGLVDNPGGLPKKLYIRIQTYPTNNASGAFNYASSVVNATTEPIVIYSEVPPILYFCAGITITDYCDTITGNQINYGTLSDLSVSTGTSQFGVATNAVGGYVVTTNGNTLTSGNRIIDALTVPTASNPGTAQFGLNLRANTSPAIGQDVTGTGIGVVDPDYDTPDLFQFIDGDIVASGATGSLFNTFTVSYIVNIPNTQPVGVYNTTIAYICTASF